MEYTVQKLARMAGISSRTLRFYDEIDLLKPAKVNSSNYRIYGKNEVDRLQQILYFRELDFNLEEIKKIIDSKDFDRKKALYEHRQKLLERKQRIDLLILSLDKTILMTEGKIEMSDREKFEGFKQKMIDENGQKYGSEIRQKYGSDTVDKSNKKIKDMTKEQYDEVNKLSEEVISTFVQAYKNGDPKGELAQKGADLHRQWLCYFWDSYSKEAHAGVTQMYVEDERFAEYYDKHQEGLAAFIKDAVAEYTK